LKRNSFFHSFVTYVLAAYLKFCFKTQRINFPDKEIAENFYKQNKPGIIAFWHGRIAFMPFICPEPERTFVMISIHRDGSLINDIISRFGISTIRGSTNRPSTHAKGAKDRGGRKAMTEILKKLKQSNLCAITPDGPKGPAMKVYPGIIKISELADAPILPISFSTTKGIKINSWDRFLLPLPFGRAEFRVGNLGKYNAEELEETLTNLTNICDKATNRTQ
jgi:lysophospholipid acyltransferase (LPLAT)-like uncharacterized protein